MFRFFIFMFLFFLVPVMTAEACSPVPITPEQQIHEAQKIFVGTVTAVHDGKARFTVEKGYKNAHAGEIFEIDMIINTCGINFEPGQQWLYMGNTGISGSQILRDVAGHVFQEHLDWVKKTFDPEP